MIPVRLELQGLYSYKGKQAIDFAQLTEAGLFGIFGAVGSGKSSILEAILLSLYGSTERLSDRGEKTSMVHLRSDSVLLDFEFKAGNNNTKSYLARYSAKRNPKNFDDVKPAEHTFYEKIAEKWVPISIKPEELVGMKKEHFKQTIIIPQGKFREFIDLTPGPRAEMMKELFGLERFDLSRKTSYLLKEVRESKIRLETQLQALEPFSEEILVEKRNQINELRLQSTEAALTLKNTEVEIQKQISLRDKNQLLKKFISELESLTLQRPDIEKQRRLHSEFIKARTYLHPVWEQIRDTKSDYEKYEVSVIDCERFKIEYAKEVAILEEQEAELKQKNQERPQRESKIRDLKKVIEIQKLESQREAAQSVLSNLQPATESKKQAQKKLESQIAALEIQAEQIIIPDSSELGDYISSAKDWKQLELQLKRLQSDALTIKKEVDDIQVKLEELASRIPTGESTYQSWSETQKAAILELEQQRDLLLEKQGLAAHIHLLHDGTPCPLCGALAHPDPLQEGQANGFAQKSAELQDAKTLVEKIQSFASKQDELTFMLENHQKSLASKNSEIADTLERLHSITSKLTQLDVNSYEDLLAKIQGMELRAQKREKLLLEIRRHRKAWETERNEIDQAEKELWEAQLKLQTVQTTISSKKEEIRNMVFCRQFFTKETVQIEAAVQKVEKDIEEVIQSLEGKQKHLREKRAEQIRNLTDIENFTRLHDQRTAKLQQLNAAFESLKVQHGFHDEHALISLFQHDMDPDKLAAQINQFDQKLAIAEDRIHELQAEEGVLEFSETAFQELKVTFDDLKVNAESYQNQVVLLDKEIQEIVNKLGQKKVLLGDFAKVETRESYLKELDRMFKGSGFVKYVSTIYLQELCNTANLRFMKLTKNSLSLSIDDDNTFWVIDYLNGGRKRLLKTLSGGQTFQASLCLALALAEKIKALNQADQSFFFMDEGFGALDKNALRVVFETLKSLRHENRIVGIISHVEELQQEISAFVHVHLDPETGSEISYSF